MLSQSPLEIQVNVAHIVSTIRAKFEEEGLTNRFFEVKPYHSSVKDNSGTNGLLGLDASNCILLEFAQPYDEFSEIYRSRVYRLLIIFSLYQETQFEFALRRSIKGLQYRDNIDRVTLWSMVSVDSEIVQILKQDNTDLIFIDIPEVDEIRHTRSFNYFVPLPGNNQQYSLIVNVVAERLIKRLKKMFHLVLSEVAAPIYDKHYYNTKIATRETMSYEEDLLNELIRKLRAENRGEVAIDVGCGTGRHSFTLYRHFESVYSYDFSPNMIAQANSIKREKDIRNIFFSVNDFEYERLNDEAQFYGRCDLVIASFGMGSFIEDTASMLRRFYEWLKPGGYIFLSFYNANAITLKVTPNWRDTALVAQIDKENNSLEVQLTEKTRFNIFCKLFDEGVEGEINKIFDIKSIVTYPMIMALLPNNMLEDAEASNAFIHADRVLSENPRSQNGYYAFVTAQKAYREVNGYINVERILKQYQAEYSVEEHEPVLSMEEVKQQIGYFPNCMIKTIVFNNRKTGEFIVILLQSEKRINKSQVAAQLRVSPHHLKFATEKEVLELGFPIGGIAPFGFQATTPLLTFVDAAIVGHSCEWFYTGIGDNRKTLKIRKADFLRIIEQYRAIEL
ncbi:YbaK/EbsC family protein [Leptolyngbya sp. ST-U4]|uniref:YbaK/EbsC family protein n=1 Tax=Leptolyngbya sp. ST-U4 TaxID=2933912 RepID=UPI003297BE91